MTDLTQLISDLESQPPSRGLSDRVLLAWGWKHYQKNALCLEFLVDPDGKKWPYKVSEDFLSGLPNPLQSIDDALLGLPEGRDIWWEVRQMYAPGSMARHFGPSKGMFNARVGLNYGEDGHLGQNDSPPLALTIAICKARLAMEASSYQSET